MVPRPKMFTETIQVQEKDVVDRIALQDDERASSSRTTTTSQQLYNRHAVKHSRSRSSSISSSAGGAQTWTRSTRSTSTQQPGQQQVRKRRRTRRRFLIHPQTLLPALVLTDTFAVSLVVPLLFQYYKAAGVTAASQREFLSSLFSSSQIAGGLLMGILTDALAVQRKTILLVSFGGSAVSYALIVLAGQRPAVLMLSRVLVGLVKQTMTISTTILTTTRCTTSTTTGASTGSTTAAARTTTSRAGMLGRLSAASTVAWIVGPSVGALVFQHVHPKAPALLACGLFVVNLLVAAVCLEEDDNDEYEYEYEYDGDYDNQKKDPFWQPNEEPRQVPAVSRASSSSSSDTTAIDDDEEDDDDDDADADTAFSEASSSVATEAEYDDDGMEHGSRQNRVNTAPATATAPTTKKTRTVLANLQSCFTSPTLASVVLAKLVYTWVTRATSYSQLGSFYEDMYGLSPHHRGYISSYQQLLQFVVQTFFVTTVLQWSGGERRAVCWCCGLMAVVVLLERFWQSLPLFLLVLSPLVSLCLAMTQLALQSLLTAVAPSSDTIFSVLAALDVLQNAVSVSVPFYRTFLFRLLAVRSSSDAVPDGVSTAAATAAAATAATKDGHHLMQGDPDPVAWIYSAFVHWLVAAVVMAVLLLPTPSTTKQTTTATSSSTNKRVSQKKLR